MHAIDIGTLGVVAGLIIPNLTNLLTKSKASGRVKALVAAVLALAAGVVQAEINLGSGLHTTTQIKQAALAAGLAWVMAQSTHYGFLVPTGITDWLKNIAPDFGIGVAHIIEQVYQVPADFLPTEPNALPANAYFAAQPTANYLVPVRTPTTEAPVVLPPSLLPPVVLPTVDPPQLEVAPIPEPTSPESAAAAQ